MTRCNTAACLGRLYETGLSVTPDNSWMRLSVASCYRQLQDTQVCRMMVQHTVTRLQRYASLGQCKASLNVCRCSLEARGKFAQQPILTADSSTAEGWFGFPQGARQALTRIFEFDPHNGHAWAVLGQMDQADGDLDAALESFRRGTTDPRAAAPHGRLLQRCRAMHAADWSNPAAVRIICTLQRLELLTC